MNMSIIFGVALILNHLNRFNPNWCANTIEKHVVLGKGLNNLAPLHGDTVIPQQGHPISIHAMALYLDVDLRTDGPVSRS